MKKKNVINLVKYYMEKNDAGFRNEAYEIARDFDNMTYLSLLLITKKKIQMKKSNMWMVNQIMQMSL